MKLRTISISIVIAIAGFTSAAAAGQSVEALRPIIVSGSTTAQCVPPNDHTGHACDGFNQLIRANFSAREIGMLFGASTSYPESQTGGIERLQKRYNMLLQEFVAAQNAPGEQFAGK